MASYGCFIVVIQSSSRVQLFSTPWTTACQASLSLTISWSLLKFMSNVSVMPFSHLIFWHPLLFLPSIFPRVTNFSSDSAAHMRWPKYWSFSFTISPSSEYSGLISFNIDLVWSPCCPRELHESSTAPQFKGFNSLVLCLLHGPALTTIFDHWEDHSFYYTDLCWQSDVSAFQCTI